MKKLLLLFIPLVFFFSCEKDNPDAISSNEVLSDNYEYPLALNNSWTYERIFTSSNSYDTITMSETLILTTLIDSIYDEKNGIFRMKISSYRADTLIGFEYCFLSNKEDGLYRHGWARGDELMSLAHGSFFSNPGREGSFAWNGEIYWYDEPIKIIKYPVELNDAWVSSYPETSASGGFEASYLVTEKNIFQFTISKYFSFWEAHNLPSVEITYSNLGIIKGYSENIIIHTDLVGNTIYQQQNIEECTLIESMLY